MSKSIVDKRRFSFFKIFKILLNFFNHKLALNHLKDKPQMAIFSFDHIGLHINLEGRYEDDTLQILENMLVLKDPLSKEKAALDVGANIGNHSVYFSNIYQKVFAFEPNPKTYYLLEYNCKYSAPNSNIETFNYGLSDAICNVHFKVNSNGNIGGSHIENRNVKEDSEEYIKVDVKDADSLSFLENVKIGLIKIDVEGHELNVVKGMVSLVKKNLPIILFEQNITDIYSDTSPTIDFLSDLNYSFAVIERNFYFGDGVTQRILSLLFRSIFGYQIKIVHCDKFRKRNYDLIVGFPPELETNLC